MEEQYLQDQLDKLQELRGLRKPFDSEAKKKKKYWYEETEDIIRQIFGKESEIYKKFYRVEHGFACAVVGAPIDWTKRNREFQEDLDEYEVILNNSLSSLQRSKFISPKPEQHGTSQKLTSNPAVAVNNYITTNVSVSLEIKQSFEQIQNSIHNIVVPEKQEEAKETVNGFETEIKKDKPDTNKLIGLLKKAFNLSKELGLKLLPYVLEHWEKIAKTLGV